MENGRQTKKARKCLKNKDFTKNVKDNIKEKFELKTQIFFCKL